MKCKEVQELLSAYQDGHLCSGEALGVKNHIQNCPACQQEEQALAHAWNMLKVLEPIEPSPYFKTRFWQRVREEESAQQDRRAGFIYSWMQFSVIARPAFALASIVLVSLLGLMFALHSLPRDPSSADQSPIVRWAQSDNPSAHNGGFTL